MSIGYNDSADIMINLLQSRQFVISVLYEYNYHVHLDFEGWWSVNHLNDNSITDISRAIRHKSSSWEPHYLVGLTWSNDGSANDAADVFVNIHHGNKMSMTLLWELCDNRPIAAQQLDHWYIHSAQQSLDT